MDEKELMEIEGILVEECLRESLRQREQFMIFVPRCECGAYVDLGAPGVAVDGDLERVPPVLFVTCPRCGRRIEAEVVNTGAKA